LIDSYYLSNAPGVRDILEEIKDYNITIYSGITLLKKKDYIKFINKYVDCLLIGLESTSDFSLRAVNKGYTYQDIQDAVDNIVKYLDRKIYLEISIILDLPCRDINDIQTNYRNIAKIQQRLINEGFQVGIHMNILSVRPNLELLYVKESLLKRSNGHNGLDVSSGRNYLISLLRQAGMDNPSLLPAGSLLLDKYSLHDLHYGYISSDVPIIRYDVQGNILPSDLNLVDEDVMRDILTRRRQRS